MKCKKSILGGDLNFSMGLFEIWGFRARLDSLSDFFTKILETYGLVDIIPTVMIPTWTNRRTGNENICKRLDRFLLSADMLDYEYFYRQWVGSGGDYDHQPVFLQILNRGFQLKSPFKFNPHWLEHEDMVKILSDTWVVFSDNFHDSSASHFNSNLKRLKVASLAWSVKQKEIEYK